MKSMETRKAEIAVEFANLLEYKSSAQMRSLIVLLDLLIDDGMVGLIDVSPDKLQRSQGAIQQLVAIRDAIVFPDRQSSLII